MGQSLTFAIVLQGDGRGSRGKVAVGNFQIARVGVGDIVRSANGNVNVRTYLIAHTPRNRQTGCHKAFRLLEHALLIGGARETVAGVFTIGFTIDENTLLIGCAIESSSHASILAGRNGLTGVLSAVGGVLQHAHIDGRARKGAWANT